MYTTKEGGVIELSAKVEMDRLVVMIKDNGFGIEKAELPYVFERLYRAESIRGLSGQKPIGTGLGLAIVKEIVHRHQGNVSVESEVGEGSTFYVSLPIWRKEEEIVNEKG